MEKNPIDKIFDENDNDPIVLYNENGEPVAFEQIALIPLDGRVYVILQPVELLEGMSEDEALVFEILQHGGEDSFRILLDKGLIDTVFEVYYTLLDEAEGE